MFSWKSIRTICAVLLLLPIVHLTYLVSQEMRATLDVSPEAWAKEVAAYAAADASSQLPMEPIVLLGGRLVTLWPGLEDLLSPRPVLMRGLGDATIDDLTHYHSELVGFYQPSVLVLLPSTSEFHIRDNKSAHELVTAIRRLIELDESYQVARHYIIFAPIKTPMYSQDYAKVDEATALLERWALGQPQISILDANSLLTLSSGAPNPDFFRLDGINLNEHGYLRISVLLQNRLAEEEAAEPYALDSTR